MVTTFNRLPLDDQLRLVRKATCKKTLLEIVEMLTKVDPIVSIRKNRQIKLSSNQNLLD